MAAWALGGRLPVSAINPVDSIPVVPAEQAGLRFTYVPADQTLGCAASATFSHSPARAVDAAGNRAEVDYLDAPLEGCGGSRTILRTHTARDAVGNTTVAVQSIHIVDETPPEFLVLPADLVLTYDDALPSEPVTAVDDCGGRAEVTFRDDYHGSDAGPMLTRTYEAVDLCGNVATHLQSILFVEDAAALASVESPAPTALAPISPEPSVAVDSLAVDAEGDVFEELPDVGGAGAGPYIYVLSPFGSQLSGFVRLEP